MCEIPCQTCSQSAFYSCMSCLDSSQVLVNTLCVTTPSLYYQIATTCCILLFVLPVIIRKRCLTLIKILDYVQIVAYFKLIKGYTSVRHVWLYAGMRSFGDWSDGWSIISGDVSPPIWTTEEGVINKTIRIGATWAFFAVAAVLIGFLKVALD